MMLAPIRALQLLTEFELREHSRQRILAYIPVLRGMGLLDAANKLSELLHCCESGLAPYGFKGFP
jgi:hypothetical protein